MNSDNNQNIEQKTENKSWWKKLLGLNPTYILILFFVLIANSSKLQLFLFKIMNNNAVKINKIAFLKEARAFHNASFLSKNEILISGGYNPKKGKGSKTTEIFNLDTKKSEFGPIMNLEHYSHVQITTKNGDVYIIDTNGVELLPFENREKFYLISEGLNFNDDKTSLMVNLTSAAVLSNDNILVVSANTLYSNSYSYLIDTKKRKIVNIPQLKYNRALCTILPLEQGNALIIGGARFDQDIHGTKTFIVPEIEIYNSKKHLFETIDKAEVTAILPFAIKTKTNQIYILEGLKEINILKEKINALQNSIKMLNNEYKILNSYKLKKNVFQSKNNSNVFSVNEDEFLSFKFSFDETDYKINSNIYLFNIDGSIKEYKTYLPSFSQIIQIDKYNFIISGGDTIYNNNKFNWILKLNRKFFCSTPYINDSFFILSEYVVPSKDIYMISLIK